MVLEVTLFLVFCLFDTELIDDIFLSSIFDSNESKSKVNFLIHNHSLGIRSPVHNVNLCDNTHSPDTFWIKASGCPNTF